MFHIESQGFPCVSLILIQYHRWQFELQEITIQFDLSFLNVCKYVWIFILLFELFHSIWPTAKQHSALYFWRLTVHSSDFPALSSWHNSLLHELTQHVKGFLVSSPVYPTVILNLFLSASCVSHGDSKFLSFSQLCIPRWPVRGFGLIIC